MPTFLTRATPWLAVATLAFCLTKAPVAYAQGVAGAMSAAQAQAQAQAQQAIYYIKSNQPCWDQAAAYHGVDPWLLYSIAYVESKLRPNAVNRNSNGTYDVGMMQVNTIWYPELRRNGIDPALLQNACASTYIGAWILAKNIRQYGYTWRAIGAYNSATPAIGYAYARRVYEAHNRLVTLRQAGWHY